MPKQKCPEGHGLPNKLKSGARCTPLSCAVEAKKEVKAAKPSPPKDIALVGTVVPVQAPVDDGDEDKAKAKRTLLLRQSQREARREIVGVPPDLKGEEAEKWADEKIVSLLPKAVAEVEYQLEYGSDEQRERAANKILDANGRGKQDRIQGQGQSIHIHLGEGFKVPWAKRVETEPKKVGDGS